MSERAQLLDRLSEAASVRRAFGEAIERDGSLVIPVARVMTGGGGGEGSKPGAEAVEQGAGGGFGLRVTPSGVFVVKDGNVRWQPAVDVNRIVLGGQILAVLMLLTVRSFARRRRHAGR